MTPFHCFQPPAHAHAVRGTAASVSTAEQQSNRPSDVFWLARWSLHGKTSACDWSRDHISVARCLTIASPGPSHQSNEVRLTCFTVCRDYVSSVSSAILLTWDCGCFYYRRAFVMRRKTTWCAEDEVPDMMAVPRDCDHCSLRRRQLTPFSVVALLLHTAALMQVRYVIHERRCTLQAASNPWAADYCDRRFRASVSLSVTRLRCANTAEQIEVLLGLETLGDPVNMFTVCSLYVLTEAISQKSTVSKWDIDVWNPERQWKVNDRRLQPYGHRSLFHSHCFSSRRKTTSGQCVWRRPRRINTANRDIANNYDSFGDRLNFVDEVDDYRENTDQRKYSILDSVEIECMRCGLLRSMTQWSGISVCLSAWPFVRHAAALCQSGWMDRSPVEGREVGVV